MKKHFLVLPIILCVTLFNCQNIPLSNDEIQLIQKIGFDQAVINKAKSIMKTSFIQYQTSDPGFIVENGQLDKTGLIEQNGILFKISIKDQYDLLDKIKKSLYNTGYLAFLTDLGWGENSSSLVIIKTKNQFDILNYEKPDGINYDITDIDLVNKLVEWDKKYKIEIIGADYDWVDFKMKNLPKNIKAFAEEVYEFCPDCVDQGVGDIESLEKGLLKKRLFLWWD